jgi:hypothetical protein
MNLIKNISFYSLFFSMSFLRAEACAEIGCIGAGPSRGNYQSNESLLEDNFDLYFNQKSSKNEFFYEELCYKKVTHQLKTLGKLNTDLVRDTIRHCLMDIIKTKAAKLLGNDPFKDRIIASIENRVVQKLKELEAQVSVLRQNFQTAFLSNHQKVCVINLFIEPHLGRSPQESLNKKVTGLIAEEKYTLR